MMEFHFDSGYKDGTTTRNEVTESNNAKVDLEGVPKSIPGSQINNEKLIADQSSREFVSHGALLGDVGTSGDVNMEATITPDDVIRAGGLGARDDISSFLPVASDSTDFEASIRDAQDYEQQLEEIRRPGLGWTETSGKE
ncbi:hypothetical protein Patl1_20434 [Pistacia atlantica]|uniref:Uncharacterized protein n=1 Tax=Pistacia atlantica TaxID=434234 RepID=A0ACC1BMV4_9ROSI|nr:hypothetical protein Patl1_20434 [Pistacia atlantica]